MKTKALLATFSLTAIFALTSMTGSVGTVANANTSPKGIVISRHYDYERLSGTDSYKTNIAIANKYCDGSASSVILASTTRYTDALASSVLANKLQAPILLVGKDVNSSQDAIGYITKHLSKSKNIFILGGTTVIPSTITTCLNKLGYSKIIRIAGSDSFSTAKLIADKENVKAGTPVVITSNSNYTDTLSIASVAAMNGYPILLTSSKGIPSITKSELQSIKPSKVIIVGNTSTIPDVITSQIKSITSLNDSNVIRLSGATASETSLAVAKYFSLSSINAVIASSANYYDPLAAVTLAAKLKAPFLFADANYYDQKAYIDSSNIAYYYVCGDKNSVSDAVITTLMLPPYSDLYNSNQIYKALGLSSSITKAQLDSISKEAPSSMVFNDTIDPSYMPNDHTLYHHKSTLSTYSGQKLTIDIYYEVIGRYTDSYGFVNNNVAEFSTGVDGKLTPPKDIIMAVSN